MLLSFDAADTLFALREPVADLYAKTAAAHGLTILPDRLAPAFQSAFSTVAEPNYSNYADGDAAERDWWHEVVIHTLAYASGISPEASWDTIFDYLFDHYAAAEAWTLFPDTIPALESARAQGCAIMVVSNFDGRLHPILDGLGLTPHFDLVVSSADACARKPDPVIFRYATARAQALGLPTDRIAHIGDSHSKDVVGATNAGIESYHLTDPAIDLHKFVQHYAGSQ